MWVELIYGVESATWRSERDMRLLTSYLVDTGERVNRHLLLHWPECVRCLRTRRSFQS
jgi:hypothetical protein